MTSSGHVTSSGSCLIDRGWPLSYRLSIGTIPLSGFVSEIFSTKFTTTIITWWRRSTAAILDLVKPEVGPFDPPSPKTLPRIKHEVDRTIRCRDMAIWNANFDDVINDVTGPDQKSVRKNFFPQEGTIMLKNQLNRTKTDGEEAFWKLRTFIQTDRHSHRHPRCLTLRDA